MHIVLFFLLFLKLLSIFSMQFQQLGPNKYFPELGHLMLNPYYKDEEVINEIIKGFNGEL